VVLIADCNPRGVILSGLTFAAMWAACCSYANEIAPVGMEATMQAFIDVSPTA
jgi:hypothetical protein